MMYCKKKKEVLFVNVTVRACTELSSTLMFLFDSFSMSAVLVQEYCVCTAMLIFNLSEILPLIIKEGSLE